MKKIFIFILSLSLFCSIYAQDRHEFSLHIGGGLSTLRYNPTLGEQSFFFPSGLDKQFGFGYAFFLSPWFGFGTGLDFAFYSAEFKLKNYETSYGAYDPVEDIIFTFRSNLSNYIEKQNAVMLQVPLMLQFQTDGGFYAMAGAKAAIPISGSSSGKGDLKTSGYYEEEDYEYLIAGPKPGVFGTSKGKKIESQEKFKNAWFVSMEMGRKWRFEDGLSLYVGGYFDYGLNNIFKKKSLESLPLMVQYNEKDTNFVMNGIFNSSWGPNRPQAFVTKVMPLAIGVKVKLAIGQGVDYFEKIEEEKRLSAAEVRRLEAEKQLLELNLARSEAAERELAERETERLVAAERLLQEARTVYEKALSDQLDAARTEDVMRLASEKAQLEQEVARLSTERPSTEIETETKPDTLTVQKVEQDTVHTSGDWVIQVAVVMQESRAESMVNSLKQKGFNAYYSKVVNPGRLTGTYFRVRVGYFGRMRDASDFAKARLQTYKDWWLDRTENDTK